jgi:polysaccharide chain length determinant protein (PEP-CTERM system associated)
MLDQFSEILYFVKGIIRYKWYITLSAVVISIAGWLYVYKMPDIYESKARVHVNTRTMLRPLLRGLTVQADVRGLVAIMQKLMFTQQNMIKVAELAGMDVDLSSEASVLGMVNQLKGAVKIEGGRDEIFSISYESSNPVNAKNVVQAVLTVFSEQTQQSTLTDAESAARFIDKQIQEYEQRLRVAEQAKETFKRENIGLLPGQDGNGQFQIIQDLRSKVEQAQMQLSELNSRKRILNQQLHEALESGEEWGLTNIVENVSEEDGRIAALEQRRTELLLKYTENHPDVVSIDYLIKELQERKAAKAALQTDEPMFSAMSNPYVQTIKMALNNIETEVATLNARIYNYNQKLQQEDKQFNERLSIETQMENLNRDYDTVKKHYLSLIDSREQARMSSNVDTQVSALKFKIIDPATFPQEPSAPNRILFYSVILVGGFVVGIGIALLVVIVRPLVVDAKQLRELTGLPILGVVSQIENERQQKRNTKRMLHYVLVNILLLMGYTGIVVHDLFL